MEKQQQDNSTETIATRPQKAGFTERTIQERDQSHMAGARSTEAPSMVDHAEEIIDDTQGRMRRLGEKATHYAEEHHLDQVPEKAKSMLSSTKTRLAVGAGGLVIAGKIIKKVRSTHAEQQLSFRQKVARRMPITR